MVTSVITVKGKVQGVGFRYFVYRNALAIGVNGFVKNMPSGDVYIEAQGSREQLNEFISMCKMGPSRARVDKVEVFEKETNPFSEFYIAG